jgi:hypothetical protein
VPLFVAAAARSVTAAPVASAAVALVVLAMFFMV